ncbi:hypothetical protein EV363DRAFT_1257157 [Boletus edulis]|nr:hypothetical protein EV363DRAFT_1273122 [Boletus edulis]KAF8123246.1 hypothetical protein EV363DRAFT_1272805 [Boletus edulis]KAF8135156.1 hypothetical protein EV363DRAFT_1257157 [Boletus edulis]
MTEATGGRLSRHIPALSPHFVFILFFAHPMRQALVLCRVRLSVWPPNNFGERVEHPSPRLHQSYLHHLPPALINQARG